MRDVPAEPEDPAAPVPPPDPGRARRRAQEARSRDRPGPQPRAGPRRHDDRRPAADPRRRRLGQDPRPRPPDRLPGQHQGRRPVADPRGHLHQPGRRRAARADHQPRRRGRAGRGGRHVPFALPRASCAPTARPSGSAAGSSSTTPTTRPSLMKQILREEDMPLTGEFRPSIVLGAISRAKNEMLDPTFLAENAANHRERTIARLATRYQERLRKANALDFDDLLLEAVRLFDEAPDVLAKYQETLALPPRRRIPGHQPGAIPVGPRAGRPPPQPVRGRRRRPVDLLVARRRPAQHPRLRARLARHRGRQARAELPLDPADPRRRPRGRLAQQRAQGQEAVDRERRRGADPALRGLQRGGGGRVDRPPGRGPGRRPRQRP